MLDKKLPCIASSCWPLGCTSCLHPLCSSNIGRPSSTFPLALALGLGLGLGLGQELALALVPELDSVATAQVPH